MTKLTPRHIEIVDLPTGSMPAILHPEQIILRISGGAGVIDVGAYCYRKREAPQKRSYLRGRGRNVDHTSFSADRTHQIGRLVKIIADELQLHPKGARSIADRLRNFLRFLDWVDTSNSGDPTLGPVEAKIAFRAYVEHLRELVVTNAISTNSATVYQQSVCKVLADLHQHNDLTEGIRLLRASDAARESTRPPAEDQQGKILVLCTRLFHQISSFVLDFSPYPFQLDLPESPEIEAKSLWVFPANCKFRTPAERRSITSQPFAAGFNYDNGSRLTREELRKAFPCRANLGEMMQDAETALTEANANPQHYQRRRLAVTAHHSFLLLFLAHTGMNWSQIRALRWEADFQIDTESQGFRAIKYRAGGKTVSFRIETGFLPQFRRYLELRKYLLNGVPCDFLFFSYGESLARPPHQVETNNIYSLYKLLRRINPHLQRINLRQWRAAKADWLIRNTDPSTAALLLQNTERTVLRHYAEGSDEQSASDLGSYFVRLSAIVAAPSVRHPTTSAVGGCRNYGTPQPMSEDVSVAPDCRQPEGCLFCDKFAVHADDMDIRKLLSCRLCITETEHLIRSDQQFQRIFEPVILRIDAIVAHIGSMDCTTAKMVDRIKSEVEDDGQLDPYWQRKIETLVSLGVIA